jgi:hypothetical protein
MGIPSQACKQPERNWACADGGGVAPPSIRCFNYSCREISKTQLPYERQRLRVKNGCVPHREEQKIRLVDAGIYQL